LVYFKIAFGKGTGYVVKESIRITERSADTNAVIQDSDIKACRPPPGSTAYGRGGGGVAPPGGRSPFIRRLWRQ
jgi:hypothetical protein